MPRRKRLRAALGGSRKRPGPASLVPEGVLGEEGDSDALDVGDMLGDEELEDVQALFLTKIKPYVSIVESKSLYSYDDISILAMSGGHLAVLSL